MTVKQDLLDKKNHDRIKTMGRKKLEQMTINLQRELREMNEHHARRINAFEKGMEEGNNKAARLITMAYQCIVLSWDGSFPHPGIANHAEQMGITADIKKRKDELLKALEVTP